MITKLSNNNIPFFEDLIPIDELDNLISRPDYFGIGVTRYKETTEEAAGVLIYKVEQDITGLVPISINIKYIFVSEDHRHDCVGSDMIVRLFLVAGKNNIETITVDTRATDDQQGLREFLATWKFNFTITELPEFYAKLEDLDLSPLVEKIKNIDTSKVCDLGDATEKQFHIFMKKLESGDNTGLSTVMFNLDKDYFHPQLSKVIVDSENEIATAFLVHENMGGYLEICLLRGVRNISDDDFMTLVDYSFKTAKAMYNPDVYIYHEIKTEEAATMIDAIMPVKKAIPSFRGILTKNEDVSPEDWMGAKEIFKEMLDQL